MTTALPTPISSLTAISLPVQATDQTLITRGGYLYKVAWLDLEPTLPVPWASVTGTPTTLAGYGITDAVPSSRTVTAGAGLSGGGALSSNITLTVADTGVSAAVYGSATQVSQVTINSRGQITLAANVTVTPAVGSITGLGTGVATALGVNVGSAGAFVVLNGALGTPSSGVLTNATGLPLTTGVTGTLPIANGGTGLATSVALNYTRVNAGNTAYENRTPAQVTTDITFLQAGTGAVARDVQTRMRDWTSIKDFGSTTADFAAALLIGGDIYIPAGTYTLTALTVSVNKTRFICAPGVTLSFPVVGASTNAITVAADDFAIIGTPLIQGPASGAYVADERAISMIGTSSAARRSGLYVDAEIKNFGSQAIYAKWTDNIRVAGTTYIHDCGYSGGMFLSCNKGVIEDGARVSTITPGTGGNAYGFTLTHNSTGYNVDPNAGTPLAANPFCADWYVGSILVETILWAGIDAHGAYDVRVQGAKVYNCRHGIHIAGSSGDAAAYGGWSNSVVNCLVDTRMRDGTAGSYANNGVGINATVSTAPATVLHQRVEIRGNTVYGYGLKDTDGSPAIGAEQCSRLIVDSNIIESWGGVGINVSSSPSAIVSNNMILQLADAADTQAMAIKQTASAALYQTIKGNKIATNGGTAALYGFYTRSTVRPMIDGNDFIVAVTAPLNLTSVNFVLGGDVAAFKSIDLGSGGGTTTIDLAEFKYGCTIVVLQLTAGAAIAVSNLTNASVGMTVTLQILTGSSNITFTRATAALAGGVDFVGGSYDTLVLQNYAISGAIQWVEVSRAANS